MKSICFAFLSYIFLVSNSYSVPPVINYAGQVAVDGEAFDGNGLFKFAIVNDSGTTTYWSNDGSSTEGSEPTASFSVSVSGGLYSILLGNSAIQGMNAIDPAVFQQHTDAKLRVWFSDGSNGFQQLKPDRSFASVPYAMTSGAALIQDGSITRSKLESSIINDLQSSIADGSVSKAKMDPNLVRYFVPEISTNPAAVSIIQGTATTLSVQAEGKFLSYQWQKNGANLAGQTNPSLVLSNANASVDDANYSVIISNDWGSVTSPLARVTVATALPTITLNDATTITHEAATPYTDAGATALDALGGDLTSSISITSEDINVTDLSQQTVIYSVTDAGGNTNTATRTVTVQDTTAPTLTLIGDSNFTHNLNSAWVDPGYDADDALDGNLTNSVSISGTVDVNSTGTYTLNYSVSDTAGNQADVNRTVNVLPVGPWTFTNAGALGGEGPNQVQIDSNYSGTNLEGTVTINTQGVQEWLIPASGIFSIEVYGAEGGTASFDQGYGGRGAYMKGNFQLSSGNVLKVVVGQKGKSGSGIHSDRAGGGGGGSFVYYDSNNLLIVAGGGGGASWAGEGKTGNDATTATNGTSNQGGNASGGVSGNGGGVINSNGYDGGGGAGWNQNGASVTNTTGGKTLSENWIGGSVSTYTTGIWGGFGGGGGANHGGGGGGGYSGGAGGHNNGSISGGGGGGSFNSGTNQDNQAGVNEGHGKVIITYIGN